MHREAKGLDYVPKGLSQAKSRYRRRHGCVFDAESVLDPGYDLVSTLAIEVDIYVGGALAATVEKSFEEQVVL